MVDAAAVGLGEQRVEQRGADAVALRARRDRDGLDVGLVRARTRTARRTPPPPLRSRRRGTAGSRAGRARTRTSPRVHASSPNSSRLERHHRLDVPPPHRPHPASPASADRGRASGRRRYSGVRVSLGRPRGRPPESEDPVERRRVRGVAGTTAEVGRTAVGVGAPLGACAGEVAGDACPPARSRLGPAVHGLGRRRRPAVVHRPVDLLAPSVGDDGDSGCAPRRQCSSETSSEQAPYAGMPSASPIALAVTMPTRSPVNGPGPSPTAIAARSAGRGPRRSAQARSRSSARAARRAVGARPR